MADEGISPGAAEGEAFVMQRVVEGNETAAYIGIEKTAAAGMERMQKGLELHRERSTEALNFAARPATEIITEAGNNPRTPLEQGLSAISRLAGKPIDTGDSDDVRREKRRLSQPINQGDNDQVRWYKEHGGDVLAFRDDVLVGIARDGHTKGIDTTAGLISAAREKPTATLLAGGVAPEGYIAATGVDEGALMNGDAFAIIHGGSGDAISDILGGNPGAIRGFYERWKSLPEKADPERPDEPSRETYRAHLVDGVAHQVGNSSYDSARLEASKDQLYRGALDTATDARRELREKRAAVAAAVKDISSL